MLSTIKKVLRQLILIFRGYLRQMKRVDVQHHLNSWCSTSTYRLYTAVNLQDHIPNIINYWLPMTLRVLDNQTCYNIYMCVVVIKWYQLYIILKTVFHTSKQINTTVLYICRLRKSKTLMCFIDDCNMLLFDIWNLTTIVFLKDNFYCKMINYQ